MIVEFLFRAPIRISRLRSRPSGHDERTNLNLHGFAILVERGRADRQKPAITTRLRRPNLQHLAFDAQFVTGTHRPWPAKIRKAGTDDSARWLHLAFDQQAHRKGGSMPAAGS